VASRPDHFNLCWYYPYLDGDLPALELTPEIIGAVPTPDELARIAAYDAALHEQNTANDVPLTPAIIVFPALCTPLLVYRDAADFAAVELLVVSRDPLTAEMVNRQLKVCDGNDALKQCSAHPLFGGGHRRKITVTEASHGDGYWSSGDRFRGLVAPEIHSAFDELDLTRWYQIRVDASCLKPQNLDFPLSMEATLPDGATKVVGLEVHDLLVAKIMRTLLDANGPSSLAGGGLYCFKRTARDVDVCTPEYHLPIQSHHPVFVYSAATSRDDIGFISDIHVNSRLRILGRNSARVIEYDDEHAAESPMVGDLVQETNRSFASVLDQTCAARPTALVLGGDFIDHLRNAYAPSIMRSGSGAPTPAAVWDAVSLEGGRYSFRRYPRYLDTTAFYSLIYHATMTHAVPMFALSGNHDAYDNAFGISPRAWVGSGKRANETIPADLNLTMYEALLAFGPSAGIIPEALSVVSDAVGDAARNSEGVWLPKAPVAIPAYDSIRMGYGLATKLLSATGIGPMFDAQWFTWLHATLTPFTDASLSLPNLTLVTLGWTEEEGMGSVRDEGQTTQHLPIASTAINDLQGLLLQTAAEKPNKVVLATHFTFISYKENHVLSTLGQKRIASGAYTDYEMGTFSKGGAAVKKLLDDRKISCVLSGHSHRRGVYFFSGSDGSDPADTLGRDVPTNGLDLTAVKSPLPAIMVVSDSAGPYPKRNVKGEFAGFGMDRPSGTLVRFESGSPTRVTPVFAARNKPRAAVALDYCEVVQQCVFKSEQFIAAIELQDAAGEAETPGYNCWLTIELSDLVRGTWKIRLRSVRLVKWVASKKPEQFSFAQGLASSTWLLWQEKNFADHMLLNFLLDDDTRWFLSLDLTTDDAALADAYDWSSVWHIELRPRPVRSARNWTFHFKRPLRPLAGLGLDTDWPEVPDFGWRANAMPEKYAP
jgi:hypothetical protein